jgi:hypothetical protein
MEISDRHCDDDPDTFRNACIRRDIEKVKFYLLKIMNIPNKPSGTTSLSFFQTDIDALIHMEYCWFIQEKDKDIQYSWANDVEIYMQENLIGIDRILVVIFLWRLCLTYRQWDWVPPLVHAYMPFIQKAPLFLHSAFLFVPESIQDRILSECKMYTICSELQYLYEALYSCVESSKGMIEYILVHLPLPLVEIIWARTRNPMWIRKDSLAYQSACITWAFRRYISNINLQRQQFLKDAWIQLGDNCSAFPMEYLFILQTKDDIYEVGNTYTRYIMYDDMCSHHVQERFHISWMCPTLTNSDKINMLLIFTGSKVYHSANISSITLSIPMLSYDSTEYMNLLCENMKHIEDNIALSRVVYEQFYILLRHFTSFFIHCSEALPPAAWTFLLFLADNIDIFLQPF